MQENILMCLLGIVASAILPKMSEMHGKPKRATKTPTNWKRIQRKPNQKKLRNR